MLKKSLRCLRKLEPQPAAEFVKAANRFDSKITLEKGGHIVNGKSMMGLMELANRQEEEMTLAADGKDALQALDVLGHLLEEEL